MSSQDISVPCRVIPAVIGVVLAMLLMMLDFATWIELNVAVVYGLPLVFAAASRRPRVLWSLAAVLIAVTFIVYGIQAPHMQPRTASVHPGFVSLDHPYLLDRSLAALMVLLTAGILQGWLFSLAGIEARDAAIAERNAQLEEANEELVRRDAEITRQNAELEARRREAESASRRKTQLLASISHDIRTPLHSISMTAEVMRRTADALAPQTRLPAFAVRVQSNALTVSELLAEVMDLASFDAGEVSLHMSEFSLADLLVEQQQRLLPVADGKGVSLQVEPPAAPLVLHTDKVKLGRVIGNLVSNAVKFTSHGRVTLASATDAEGRVCIRVADTGCGIRPENLERIFGDFCQGDSAAVHTGSGWGLGLAICRRLTTRLGGELRVESALGQGSTFTVVLPRSVVGGKAAREQLAS